MQTLCGSRSGDTEGGSDLGGVEFLPRCQGQHLTVGCLQPVQRVDDFSILFTTNHHHVWRFACYGSETEYLLGETAPAIQGSPPVGQHPSGNPVQPRPHRLPVDLVDTPPRNGEHLSGDVVGFDAWDSAGAVREHLAVVTLKQSSESAIRIGGTHRFIGSHAH